MPLRAAAAKSAVSRRTMPPRALDDFIFQISARRGSQNKPAKNQRRGKDLAAKYRARPDRSRPDVLSFFPRPDLCAGGIAANSLLLNSGPGDPSRAFEKVMLYDTAVRFKWKLSLSPRGALAGGRARR